MEIEGSDGSKTQLKPNFGRANQFNAKDLSISRRHISFDIISPPDSPNTQTSPRVSFEVLGKNPVWVYSKNGDKKVKIFKRFERGELGFGDYFCVSGKTPVWFTLKKVEDGVFDDRKGKSLEMEGKLNEDLSKSLDNNSGFDDNDDFGLDYGDVSNIDPVQEFGFLVIGHEFDHYPKNMIRQIKDWDWFLEVPVGDIDDEETDKRKGKRGGKRKRKKTSGDDDVDEEWTAESEGKELTAHASKVRKPKYSTRSTDPALSGKNRTNEKTSTSSRHEEEEYEDEEEEEEEDETLGGFIVDDDNVEEEEDEGNEVDEDEDELEE